jgi:hypothetical protein
MRAFHSDPLLKAKLRAEFAGSEAASVAAPRPSALELTDWARAAGLPAALVLLAAHLDDRGRSGNDQPTETTSFLADLVELVEPGAPVSGLAGQWTLWAWNAAAEPLKSFAVSVEVLDAGEALMALHTRAATGIEVGRGEWRAARARLGRLSEQDGEDASAAAVIAACAWDYEVVPGAAADLAVAWEQRLMARASEAAGWSNADSASLQALISGARALAEAELGPEPARDELEDFADYRRRLVGEIQTRLGASDNPLLARNAEKRARVLGATSAFREDARKALLSLAAGSTPPHSSMHDSSNRASE